MKKYSVTFYDLIGYLVPGLFFTLSIATTSSLLFQNGMIVQKVYTMKWPWHLVLGYVSGHIIQAITTAVLRFDVGKWWKKNGWDPQFKKKIISLLGKEMVGNDKADIIPNTTHAHFAENYIKSDIQIDRAETFRALQGFFRGMAGVLASMFFASGLFFILKTPFELNIADVKINISPSVMAVIGILCGLAAVIFYYRFRQFAGYRLRTIFLAFYAASTVNGNSISEIQ